MARWILDVFRLTLKVRAVVAQQLWASTAKLLLMGPWAKLLALFAPALYYG